MEEIEQTFGKDDNKSDIDQSHFKSYVYAAPNKKHARTARAGCLIFFVCLVIVIIGMAFAAGHRTFFVFLFVGLAFALGLFTSIAPFFSKMLYVNEIIELYDDKVIIKDRKIYFTDIANYKIQYFDGVAIFITLISGGKILLRGRELSESVKGLEIFAHDFDATLKELISNKQLPIKRKKSLMESNWLLVFLIPSTFIFIGSIVYGYIKGIHMPVRFLFYFAALIPLWPGFLISRRENKISGK